MKKNFFRDNSWKYFYSGFQLDSEGMHLSVAPYAFNDSVLFNRATAVKSPKTKVGISAIIGKNGTGKSTIVELLIRIFNNLSAATFEEYANYAAAEHLHYIDYVFAELCYTVGGRFFILSVKGREVTLRELVMYKWLDEGKLSKADRDIVGAYGLQMLRTASSVSANLNEAKHPQSDGDYLSKATIALKKARETEHWLRLLNANGYVSEDQFVSMNKDLDRILRILVAITIKVRERLKAEKHS